MQSTGAISKSNGIVANKSNTKSSCINKSTPSQKVLSSNEVVKKSPDPGNEQNAIKRLPPIKAPVGLAKSPDLSNCKSKIGSLANIKHNPAGGDVIIPNQKLTWNAKSKVGSLDNKEHKPGGGQLVVESKKLDWKTGSKVQSLANINHKPGGGNVKIFNDSYAKSKQQVNNNNNNNDYEKCNKQNGLSSTEATTNKLTRDIQKISIK